MATSSGKSGDTMHTVYVADNFHEMDEGESYRLGEYVSWQAAVAEARRIVDESLAEVYCPGISATSL